MSLQSGQSERSPSDGSDGARSSPEWLRAIVPAALVLAASTIAGEWTFQFARAQERARAETQFYRQVDRTKAAISERIGRTEDRMRALQGLFRASHLVEPYEFFSYARVLGIDDPEMGIRWVAYYRQRGSDGAASTPEFIYPMEAKGAAWSPDENDAALMNWAPALSVGPISGRTIGGEGANRLVLSAPVPVSMPLGIWMFGTDDDERGWVVAEINTAALFSSIVDEGSGGILGMTHSEAQPSEGADAGVHAASSGFAHSWHVPVGGSLWKLTLFTRPGYQRAFETTQPILLMIGEVGIGVLAAGLVLSLASTGKRARTMAAEMTSALRTKEQFYRAIVEDQTELICRFTPDGVMTFVNEAYCRYFCREREDLVGRRYDPAIVQQDRAMAQGHISALTQAQPVGVCVYRAVVPGGEVRWQEWTHRAIFAPSGAAIEYQAVGRDITEERTMQNALRKSLARVEEASREISLRQFALDQAAAVCTLDGAGVITQANDALCALLRCERPQTLGRRLSDWMLGNEEDRAFMAIRETVRAEGLWKGEMQLQASDGTTMWLDSTVIPGGSRHGADDRLFVIGRDITDARQAADRLRLSEERLDLAVRGSNVGLWDWNLVSGEVFYSARFRELLGFDSEREFPNTTEAFESRLHPDDREPYRLALEAHIARQEPFDIEVRVQNAAGDFRWLHSRAGAATDSSGRAVRMAGSVTDITDKKRNEAALEGFAADLLAAKTALEEQARELERKSHELERARFAAESANRAKSDFLANMSHEIRTPMTAILGYADLLLEAGQSESDRKECVQIVRRNGEHLLSLINDILDLSKIEAGRMTVELIECNPWEIARDVAEMLGSRARLKGITLGVETVGAIPRLIRSDPTRLRQILLNLVGNAIKFTEIGGVRVLVRMAESCERDGPRIAFEVIDTGIGMAPEVTRKLFQPFTQADHSMSRRFGGTGLGLTISRRFAELLGGGIEVTSTPGDGSCFRIVVATGSLEQVELVRDYRSDRSQPDATEKPRGDARLDGVRILVAEDGPDNQRLISHYLKKAGAEFAMVANGREAVDAARESASGEGSFDLILMDMQMPVMDGYAAARELKQSGTRIPIIGLTAHAMSGDRERCISAGCDEYLTKPIDRTLLIATCATLLETSDGAPLSRARSVA